MISTEGEESHRVGDGDAAGPVVTSDGHHPVLPDPLDLTADDLDLDLDADGDLATDDVVIDLRTSTPVRVGAASPLDDDLVLPELALEAPAVRPIPRSVPGAAQWVGALTAIGFVLRLAFIGAQSMWLDETLSLQQAQMPLVDMWRFQLTENVHVPLYHTLLHLWIDVVGPSTVSLRLFSVLCGTACIPLLYVVIRRLFDQRVGIIATAIGAAAPFWIWHADEVRMYPLVLLAGLSSMALLFRAHDRGGFWRWAAYAVVTGIGFYAHYFLILMPAVHLLWLVAQRSSRRTYRNWVAAAAVAGLGFVPWLVLLVQNRVGGGSEFTNYGTDYLSDANPFAIGYAVLTFVAVFLVGYHSVSVLEVVSALIVGSWPLLAVARSIRRSGPVEPARRAGALFLGGWLASLVLGVYLIDLVKPGVWYQKYLVMASVPAIGLLALVLNRIGRNLVLVVGAVLVVFAGLTVAQNVEPDNPVRQDWASATDVVEAGFRSGDVIAVLPAFNTHTLDHYWDDRSPIWGLVAHSYEVDDAIEVDLQQIREGHGGATLWVVSSHPESFDRDGRVTSYLHDHFEPLTSQVFPASVRVESFRIPPIPTGAAEPGDQEP